MKAMSTWFFGVSALCVLAPCEAMAQSISASLVVAELKSLGHSADIDKDDSGDPRINTKVDGYAWSVYMYDCEAGVLQERQCTSFQFYSGYSRPKATPLQTINKWNIEERYAKAYNYVQKDGKFSSRIEIDVLVRGTDADPAKTFRLYFDRMKKKAIDFRKVIGFT